MGLFSGTITPTIQLRDYQLEALDKVRKSFEEYKKVLLVSPTGSGKTILLASAALRYWNELKAKTLILAHREELLEQAADKIFRTTGLEAEIEKAEREASHDAPVVVASVQTLMREKRRANWPSDHFGLIVIDESHHALADSYQNTLNYFAGEGSHTHVLGVTATPDRGDKKNLGKYFQTIAHEIQLVDLIKAGYLSKINIKTMPIKIDLSGVRTVAGDYDAHDLGDHLGRYLREIAKSISEHAVMRKVLVFLPLICTSQAFVKVCNEIGLTAAHVDGNSPDREQILKDYANGKYDVLSNAMLLTEGYDCPLIDCVVPLRPTKVRALYSQMVGRGTRIAIGKSNLLLLDFLWLHEEHDLIKPAHLIAQTEYIAQKMGSLQGDEEIDIEELQQRAIGQIEEELQAESEARQQRENKLKEQLKANAGRERKLIDAVDFFTSLHDVTDAEYEPTMPWEYDPPSDKQLQSIARMGINPESISCKGHASRILDRVFTRRKLNLATPKQVAYLKKMGHPSPENATFDEAKAFLDSMFNRPKFARVG